MNFLSVHIYTRSDSCRGSSQWQHNNALVPQRKAIWQNKEKLKNGTVAKGIIGKEKEKIKVTNTVHA